MGHLREVTLGHLLRSSGGDAECYFLRALVDLEHEEGNRSVLEKEGDICSLLLDSSKVEASPLFFQATI